ncbi:MAG: pseudouridine synthase [Solidesulfovibrio sp.]
MTHTTPMLRLNKVLADAGVCSRRQADALISAGRVTVNGTITTEMGTRIDPGRDKLAVDGKPVTLSVAGDALTLLLYKLPGVVTTANDPEGRPTVFDKLPEAYRSRRLFSVGRLDFFSEGLLLLTTDGELAFRLAHARWHVSKRYMVTVRGHVSAQTFDTMARGMTLAEGEQLAPVRARLASRLAADRFVLEMELTQGVNRQIRRMCRDLELTVLKLVRVSQGPLALGKLPPGKCRELAPDELAALYRSVALKKMPPATKRGAASSRPPRQEHDSPRTPSAGRRPRSPGTKKNIS